MPGSEGFEGSDAVAARCRRVDVDYRTTSGVVHALRNVDADFGTGQLSVIAGPSGSGKSSLLRVLAGLQRPHGGQVEVNGTELTRRRAGVVRRLRRQVMGFVLQKPADNLLPYLRAIEQVELAARLRRIDRHAAAPLLEALGLAGRTRRLPAELSGGEQQRVAFAAAAVGDPALVLADEPTAELDTEAGARLIEAMRLLVDRGGTLVVASHDPAVIAAASHVVRLTDGVVTT